MSDKIRRIEVRSDGPVVGKYGWDNNEADITVVGGELTLEQATAQANKELVDGRVGEAYVGHMIGYYGIFRIGMVAWIRDGAICSVLKEALI